MATLTDLPLAFQPSADNTVRSIEIINECRTKQQIITMDELDNTQLDMRLPNLLLDRGIIDQAFYNFIATLNLTQLENHIFNEIENYDNNTDIEKLFHLIQIWGGWTGRIIYVRGGGFKAQKVMPHYRALIDACLSVHDNSEDSLNNVYEAIEVFNRNVKNISISFITKHTRFWLYKNLHMNALPIYDKVMAGGYMHKNNLLWKDLRPYWQLMIQQAEEEHVTLMQLERRLFNQYRR